MPELITNNRRPRFRNRKGQFAGTGGRFTTDTLSAGIANFVFKTREVMEEQAVKFAEELQEYAQKNAPWDNRTGDARAGLDTEVEATDRLLSVSLFHTVDYGIWLEIRWNGRYAIIIPSVEKKGSELLERWEGILDRTVYYR